MFTIGCSGRRPATGCRWRSPRMAPTASRRDIDLGLPGAPTANGSYEVVQGLEIDEFSRARIDATVNELRRGARRGEGAGADLESASHRALTAETGPRNSAKTSSSNRSASGRMPALSVPADLTLRHELGHHPVQVVRLDLQLLRDLRDRDPGPVANELERLVGARTAAAATARPTGPAGGAGRTGGSLRGRRRT